MPFDPGYRDYILALLDPLGHVRGRSMFGGVGIYEGDAIFAVISNDTLYFKVDAATRDNYAGCEQFYNMPYFAVPADWLDDEPLLHARARDAIAVGHVTARVKSVRKRRRA